MRSASADDALEIGELLDAFNREFNQPTPGPRWLAGRIAELLSQDTLVLLAGSGPDGLAVLRLRRSLWSPALEGYLAELYVVPEQRGQGLGRTLMLAVIDTARQRGADHILLGTSEEDHAARALYESLGFINREQGPHGPITYFYELDLSVPQLPEVDSPPPERVLDAVPGPPEIIQGAPSASEIVAEQPGPDELLAHEQRAAAKLPPGAQPAFDTDQGHSEP